MSAFALALPEALERWVAEGAESCADSLPPEGVIESMDNELEKGDGAGRRGVVEVATVEIGWRGAGVQGGREGGKERLLKRLISLYISP
jgi:hypothetical protein